MPIEVTMPALSPTMTEGNLAKWLKKEGDKVEPGDVIAEIETDKATMEVEAVDEGTIGKILIQQGAKNVKVNEVIALLLQEGESKKDLEKHILSTANKNTPQKKSLESQADKSQSNSSSAATNQQVVSAEGFTPPPVVPKPGQVAVKKNVSQKEVIASPLAKRLAQESGIAVDRLVGSGPNGRVVKEDVEEAMRTGVSMGRGGQVVRDEAEQYAIENSNMRQVIANRLLQSKQHVPHFYLTIECEIDKLLELRQDLNDKAPIIDGKAAYKLSVNDLMIKASALALRDVPAVNASWTKEAMIRYTNVDISVAVAVEEGLVTPIIRNADQKSAQAISIEMKKLAQKAKDGKLTPEEFQGGGFSLSNLGMYGIKEFKAIINPPQSCILAVGAGEERPVIREDELHVATMVTISLSCDHRVVDGAVGAQFLQVFKNYIERPVWLFV